MDNSIIRYLKRIKNFSKPAGNNLTIFEDDTFIVSYPRSGNTWVRFLLGNYLFGEKFDFLSREKFIPAIKGNTNRDLLKTPRPRMLKSHSLFYKRYPKVIYLLRDPRDVMISHFIWSSKNLPKKRKIANYNFETYAELFFTGDFPFGRWDEHVQGWTSNSSLIRNGFLLVKYEDLKSDTFNYFTKIIKFLNLEYDEMKVKTAIDNSSFQKMKQLESAQQEQSKKVLPRTGKTGFVGSGKVEWELYLTGNLKSRFKSLFNDLMIKYNYINSSDW
ncbi:MAG: sulfotransferase domain-containing protein [Ignavibacteriaceae bacterium]